MVQAICAVSQPGSPFVIQVKHRGGVQVPPHWHSVDESITVISGTLVMGLGDRFDLSTAREFPAGSFLTVPKNAPHFALCKGETMSTGMAPVPLIRPSFARKRTRALQPGNIRLGGW
jgi:quercetin dioxygenase-like cupin family protein